MRQTLLIIFLITVSSLSFGHFIIKPDCSLLKQGTFRYLDIEDTTAYFVIEGDTHTEYHQHGKYNIKSKLVWKNDCQYSMLMLSNTIPGFPYKPGDVMLVTIKGVKGDTIYYASEVNGQHWDGRLLKIK